MNLPSVIMEDFSADVSKLASSSTLAKIGDLHLQQLFSAMYGVMPPTWPTCKEATTPDIAFLSPELLPRLQSIEVLQDQLFDAHKVVLLLLRWHSGNLTMQIWPKPKSFTNFLFPRRFCVLGPTRCLGFPGDGNFVRIQLHNAGSLPVVSTPMPTQITGPDNWA